MINNVGVIGAGTMGNGIAQVFAHAGFQVLVHDVAQSALDRGRAGIEKSLAKFVEKGKIDAASRDAALGRLRFSTSLDGVRGGGLRGRSGLRGSRDQARAVRDARSSLRDPASC